jgi:hypothetical protein
MAKPQKRIIAKHIFLWFIWYSINTIQLIDYYDKVKTIEWIQIAYNLLSLLIIFYSIARLMSGYFEVFSLQVYYRLNGIMRIKYLLKWQLIICLAITFSYVGLSYFLDKYYFGNFYPNMLANLAQRLSRVIPYVLVANWYCYLKYYKKEVKKDKDFSERRLKVAQTGTIRVRKIYEQLIEEKSSN